MLAPPCDAEEGFVRLDPDLDEIAGFIGRSPLSAREREKLAIMLADYFTALAAAYRRPQLELVHDASREPAERLDTESVRAHCTLLRGTNTDDRYIRPYIAYACARDVSTTDSRW